ncbi:hypothetical protein FKP32DRAFT_1582428, partial [Trametes sanguinea]
MEVVEDDANVALAAGNNDIAFDASPGPPQDTAARLELQDVEHLSIASDDLRHSIIAEWEQVMTTARLQEVVCAVCARRTPPDRVVAIPSSRVPLEVLRNPALPALTLPRSYNFAAYNEAILHPKGLTDLNQQGPMNICQECRGDLFHAQGPRMPLYALANWLYYGHDALPVAVRDAFQASTQVERMLISRARSSKVSFKFCDLVGHSMHGTDPRTSQGCVKGNVAIHPQDATHLTEVLPPSYDSIRDTICAIFVGRTQPTRDNIRDAKLSPVLVRKSRVRTMIDFLIENNPEYAVSEEFQGYSARNMDALFDESGEPRDEGVLCAMEIGHISGSDAVEGATHPGYVPGPQPGSDDSLLMENVGYTDSDSSLAVNPRKMTLEAVAHCLQGRSFLKVQAGSRFIPDFENPALLSWLFPHLDPWGIGGFHHRGRPQGRRLSLEQQLKYLLQVDDSPFRRDPNFAFVYYNIRQKKSVFDSVSFRVSSSQRDRVISELLQLNVKKVDALAKAFRVDPTFKATSPDDVAIMKLMARVSTVSHDLPGSNGYKKALRNQIRGLIYQEGTPTLFITLNPADRDHPLVRLYAGHEIVIEDHLRGEELSQWQRTQLAARNPAACARFFDRMMRNFINVILKPSTGSKGLFG